MAALAWPCPYCISHVAWQRFCGVLSKCSFFPPRHTYQSTFNPFKSIFHKMLKRTSHLQDRQSSFYYLHDLLPRYEHFPQIRVLSSFALSARSPSLENKKLFSRTSEKLHLLLTDFAFVSLSVKQIQPFLRQHECPLQVQLINENLNNQLSKMPGIYADFQKTGMHNT